MMFDYTGIFRPYSQIGQYIDQVEDQEQLLQTQLAIVEPLEFRSTIQFNSTYMELVDKIYYERGLLTFFGIISASIPAFIAIISINYFILKCYTKNLQNIDYLILLFGLCVCLPAFYFIYKVLLKKDTFSYTHFPMRFNRKNKMVYSFKPDGTVGKYHWDDLYIAIMVSQHDPQKPHLINYDIRFNVLDEHRIIVDAFALPFCEESTNDQEKLMYKGLWEYVRRYMEDGVADSYSKVDTLIPIVHRRETLWQSIKVAWWSFNRSNSVVLKQNEYTGTYQEDLEENRRLNIIFPLIQGMFFNFLLVFILGRYAIAKLGKRPVWPKWVEEECQIDTDDPYDLNQHPKPKAAKPPFTFVQVLVYGLTLIFAYLNLYATLWFIDLLTMAKDADISLHGLLEFWHWFG